MRKKTRYDKPNEILISGTYPYLKRLNHYVYDFDCYSGLSELGTYSPTVSISRLLISRINKCGFDGVDIFRKFEVPFNE